jgi:hypothetical protein
LIMSDEPVYVGGGFGDSSTAPKSENLRIRMEVAAEMEAAEAARAEKDRQRRAEIFQERAIQDAIAAAVAAGEFVNPRQAMQGGGTVGHEPREFIERASLQMDMEDFQAEASAAAEYRRWLADRGEASSADVSAPTPAEVQLQAQEQERMNKFLDRKRQRELAVQDARSLAAKDAARGDRQVLGRVAAAAAVALSGEAGYQTGYRMDSTA